MAKLRISDAARIRVRYDDRTMFGSAIDDEIGQQIHVRCQDIIDARKTSTMAMLVARSRALLDTAFAPEALGAF